MRPLPLLAVLGALAWGCPSGPRQQVVWECVWEGTERPDWLVQIGCGADFDDLAGEPLSPVYGQTDSVKLAIDLHEDDALYFFDSIRWVLHYDFCLEVLSRPDDPIPSHGAFNQREYFSQDRRFLLGTIEHYRALELYTLEFAAGDQIENDDIEKAYWMVARSTFFGEELRFRPVSREQEERTSDLDIPKVGYDEIFSGQTYQPLGPGEAYGYVRLVPDGAFADTYLGPRDVVVTDSVPNDLPVVAALVTSEFQAPLSHVAVLSHGRGTPNMALREAIDDARFTEAEGTLVHLVVAPQDFTIEPATLEEAEAFWEARRPGKTFVPAIDLSRRDLVDAETIRLGDIPWSGAKAAGFGELLHIEEVAPFVPEGFVVPLARYLEHLARAGLDVEVAEMLADEEFRSDYGVRRSRLAALRASILSAEVDPELLSALEDKIRADQPALPPMRFRSSSNAEDLSGFSGAGLYDSKTGDLDDADRPIADALRTVWASLWNEAAFEEREWYRIDHAACAMAVLVHPSFPDEEANGVAITVNPFNVRRPAYFVNVQMGEVSVVDSVEIAEQFLYYTWYPEPQVEYLSRSTLAAGEDVLSPEEIETLAEALSAIREHFLPLYVGDAAPGTFGMDVEFKLDGGTRALVIKQARPYWVSE